MRWSSRRFHRTFGLETRNRKPETALPLPPVRSGSILGDMNLGFPEMIFLFLFALILFGPKKLPEIGRQIGRALNEFKRASNEFKAQIEAEISQLDVQQHRQSILPPVQAPAGSVASGSLPPAEISVPEGNSLAKAPDA